MDLVIGVLSWSKQHDFCQVLVVEAGILFVGLQLQGRVGAARVNASWVITLLIMEPHKKKFLFAGLGLAGIVNYYRSFKIPGWAAIKPIHGKSFSGNKPNCSDR
jgi:hypothetical protein